MNRWKRLLCSLRVDARTAMGQSEEDKTNRYLQIYRGNPPWHSACGNHTLHLGRTVARELAMAVCGEMGVSLSDTARGRYLSRALDGVIAQFSDAAMGVLGVGCGMFLISASEKGEVRAEFFLPDRYAVTQRGEEGEAIAVSFFEQCEKEGERYLRIQSHRLLGQGRYRIENKAVQISSGEEKAVPLATIDRWASLPACLEMEGIDTPFFVEWRLPCGEGREQGEAIYAGAIDLMQDADRQYERLLWEFEGGELAIDASAEAFLIDDDGQAVLPAGKDRLFRMNAIDAGSEKGEMMQVFAPALRDESLIRGLNRILCFFEDAVGVARGTVSDPSVAAKTATEVRSSRQRTYLTVVSIQKQVKTILEKIVRAMDTACTLYRLCPRGNAMLTVHFGDSVLSDSDTQREQDRADVLAGLMEKDAYMEKWTRGGKENDA